jgi:hypothetical protein
VNRIEQQLHRAILQWAGYCITYQGWPLYPHFIFHVPNGGARSRIEAAIFKGIGVRTGVPDLVIPIANADHGALWIELKADGRDLCAAQIEVHERLRAGAQQVCTCRSLEEARRAVLAHLARAPGVTVERGRVA